jgi:hypothetical protein
VNTTLHIAAWEARLKKRQARLKTFSSEIVAPSLVPYFFYRLRFFGVITFAEFAFHIAEFFIVFSFLNKVTFGLFIVLRIIIFILNAAWWGGLEAFRAKIRRLHKKKNPAAISETITIWMWMTSIIAIFLISLLLFFINTQHLRSEIISPFFVAYTSIILIDFGLGLIVRTFHDGVYAIARIRMPVSISVAQQVIFFLLLLVTWPFGKNAFPYIFALSSLISFSIKIFYELRTYQFLGIPLSWSFNRKSISHLGLSVNWSVFVLGLFSGVFVHIDWLLLLGLYFIEQANSQNYSLFISIYFLRPIIKASTDWPVLFYFDLKKIDTNKALEIFKKRFDHALLKLSLFIAAILSLFYLLLISFTNFNHPYLLTLIFVPFLFFNSVVSYYKISLFCEKKYVKVILTGLLNTVMILFALEYSSDIMSIPVTILIGVLTLVYLHIENDSLITTKYPKEVVLRNFWTALNQIKYFKHQIVIHQFTFSGLTLIEIEQMLMSVFEDKKTAGYLSALDKNRVIFFQLYQTNCKITDTFIQIASAGTLRSHSKTNEAPNGSQAIQTGIANSIFYNQEKHPSIKLLTMSELILFFTELFPEGIHCKITNAANLLIPHYVTSLKNLSTGILTYVKNPLAALSVERGYYSIGFLPDSEDILFFIPTNENIDKKRLHEWYNILFSINLQRVFMA